MSGNAGSRWHTCPDVSWTLAGPWDRDKFSRGKRPWRKILGTKQSRPMPILGPNGHTKSRGKNLPVAT